MPRRCFYSFHYEPDNWRAATIRNIGSIEGNRPAADNDWESISRGPNADERIRRWIADQMNGRTCCIVLVGNATAGRKWITHEIVKAWDDGLGVVAIDIHGFKDRTGATTYRGANPLESVRHSPSGQLLSAIARRYDPPGAGSQERYAWLSANLEAIVDEAVAIRRRY
jgi:hypothetical protein